MANQVHHHHRHIVHSKLHSINLSIKNTVRDIENKTKIKTFVLIILFSGQQVAGNADGFVQTILNDMENLHTNKEKRNIILKS